VEAENRVTFAYLEQIPGARTDPAAADGNCGINPKYGAPFKKGGRYFFFKNSGLQNQSVLYTQSALTTEPAVLLDPNTLSADGTVALSGSSRSPKTAGRWCTARREAARTGRNSGCAMSRLSRTGPII